MMRGLARKLKDWWQRQPAPAAAAVPFEVTCACGQKLTGLRQATHQVVVCPRCAAERFVLPRSPFPLASDNAPAPAPSTWSAFRPYLFPLAAAGITLLVLIVLLAYYLTRGGEADLAPEDTELHGRLAQAHRSMKAGNFRLAAEAFAGLTARLEELPEAERRHWSQLTREASLLADLSSEGLEEILLQAARTGDAEWQADFQHRYHGRAILFDATVQRRGKGYRMLYSVVVDEAGGKDARRHEAHLELGDLVLLKELDLDQPRRLIFGVRLASVGREAPGPRWVIRFLPDSGVLLTDADAAAWACPDWSDGETEAWWKSKGK
jgi:hypothetical protein